MGIWVQWRDDKETTIQYIIHGSWEGEDLTSLSDIALRLCYGHPSPVHLIIDVAGADAPPLGFPLKPQMHHLLKLMCDHIGIVVFIGDNVITRNIVYVLGTMKTEATQRVFIVNTPERARQIITNAQAPS